MTSFYGHMQVLSNSRSRGNAGAQKHQIHKCGEGQKLKGFILGNYKNGFKFPDFDNLAASRVADVGSSQCEGGVFVQLPDFYKS